MGSGQRLGITARVLPQYLLDKTWPLPATGGCGDNPTIMLVGALLARRHRQRGSIVASHRFTLTTNLPSASSQAFRHSSLDSCRTLLKLSEFAAGQSSLNYSSRVSDAHSHVPPLLPTHLVSRIFPPILGNPGKSSPFRLRLR